MTGPARPAIGIAAVAVTVLALSGCSAPAGGMSKAEACRSLEPSMATVSAGLNATFSNLSTDPIAAAHKLEEVTAVFHNTTKTITNPKVRKVGDAADKALNALTIEVRRALANPRTADQASLEIASNALEKDFTAVDKACA